MQEDLFETDNKRKWDLGENCSLLLYRDFFHSALAESYFSVLCTTIAWQQSEIQIAGRWVKIPRLNAWYGDPDALYQYSGTRFKPLTWLPELLQIKQSVEQASGYEFNSVLANLYRDGRDSVAWHADDETELGINPAIASVSFGGTRRFQLKHKTDKSRPRLDLDLPGNSLLLMSGKLQHRWKHQVPKLRGSVGRRLNLTFRWINMS